MLIFDFHAIGNKLYAVRKRMGMTQAEVAEAAGLSDRTYADIERGSVNMRVETLLRICKVLYVTPDVILTEDENTKDIKTDELIKKIESCNSKEKETILKIINVYLQSII
ncbi:MAG: helix-turn-helix transcriptional regulator [Clostridia bacterium]|nr:helix-turn-helix transcriptional regulator [Clostridia bacterium]